MGDRVNALTPRVALTAHRVAKAPTTKAWRTAGVICRISSCQQRRDSRPGNEPLREFGYPEQVALAVLEPGRLGVAEIRDSVDRLEVGVVVLLELEAACAECVHLGDVTHDDCELRVTAGGRAPALEQPERRGADHEV